MSAFAVRPDELFALGRELTSSSAQLRDAVDAYDHGFAAIGEQLAEAAQLIAARSRQPDQRGSAEGR
ncbi:MAG: hypothetical protein M4D85_07440 [Actinomycetota bacterium]|nr:hypothetical protein [Actinomycetota bacterium]